MACSNSQGSPFILFKGLGTPPKDYSDLTSLFQLRLPIVSPPPTHALAPLLLTLSWARLSYSVPPSSCCPCPSLVFHARELSCPSFLWQRRGCQVTPGVMERRVGGAGVYGNTDWVKLGDGSQACGDSVLLAANGWAGHPSGDAPCLREAQPPGDDYGTD